MTDVDVRKMMQDRVSNPNETKVGIMADIAKCSDNVWTQHVCRLYTAHMRVCNVKFSI